MSTDCWPGAADYRRNAEDCLRLADRVSPETRAVLIMMAQAWLRLAYAKNAANVKPDLIALD
jgi:hypothetical protein